MLDGFFVFVCLFVLFICLSFSNFFISCWGALLVDGRCELEMLNGDGDGDGRGIGKGVL